MPWQVFRVSGPLCTEMGPRWQETQAPVAPCAIRATATPLSCHLSPRFAFRDTGASISCQRSPIWLHGHTGTRKTCHASAFRRRGATGTPIFRPRAPSDGKAERLTSNESSSSRLAKRTTRATCRRTVRTPRSAKRARRRTGPLCNQLKAEPTSKPRSRRRSSGWSPRARGQSPRKASGNARLPRHSR